MPRSGTTTDENVGGALRAAIFSDQTFLVTAGTAPPTFIKLFSEEFFRAARRHHVG